jgi:hypothetical protein
MITISTDEEEYLLMELERIGYETSGIVLDKARYSDKQWDTLKYWGNIGFVKMNSIKYKGFILQNYNTYRFELSDELIDMAHKFRKDRIKLRYKETELHIKIV